MPTFLPNEEKICISPLLIIFSPLGVKIIQPWNIYHLHQLVKKQFFCEIDFKKKSNKSISSLGTENEKVQSKNRAKVLEMADYIVPGHGPIFRVNK